MKAKSAEIILSAVCADIIMVVLQSKVCHNSGEVIGTGSVGGVCGKVLYSKITNCYNTNTGKVTGSRYVGGVCGEIEVDGGTATIEN